MIRPGELTAKYTKHTKVGTNDLVAVLAITASKAEVRFFISLNPKMTRCNFSFIFVCFVCFVVQRNCSV